MEAALGLHDDAHAHLKGQADACLGGGVPQAGEVFAPDVFHGDEVGAVPLADVVDGDDVRVVERGGDARLVEELFDELSLFVEVGAQRFQDRQAIEHARLAREKHLAHAALRDAANLLVLAKHQSHATRTLAQHRRCSSM